MSHPPRASRSVQIPTLVIRAGLHTNPADRRLRCARRLGTSQQPRWGSSARRRPRVSLTLHDQRSHQGPSQKTDFACHACHFRDFCGKNSQFRICKQARREEGRQVGDTVTLPSHSEGGLAQHTSSTPKARDRKPKTRARSFPRHPASRPKPPA